MERDDNLKLKYATEEEIKYLQKNKGALTKFIKHDRNYLSTVPNTYCVVKLPEGKTFVGIHNKG